MKKFQFKADVVFEAEDVNDVFDKLASHFLELTGIEGESSLDILSGGFNICLAKTTGDEAMIEKPSQGAEAHADLLARFKHPLTPYGILVRALRIVADTTLQEMATHMGTTPATLSSMESGRKEPNYMDLCATRDFFQARGFDVSFELLSSAWRRELP